MSGRAKCDINEQLHRNAQRIRDTLRFSPFKLTEFVAQSRARICRACSFATAVYAAEALNTHTLTQTTRQLQGQFPHVWRIPQLHTMENVEMHTYVCLSIRAFY